jgi:outer membrane protein
MRRILALFLASAIAAPFALASDQKFGVVDMQKALQSVEDGKKAKTTLEKEFNEKKKQIQAEEDSLKKATEDFKKQSMVLSEDARNRKQNELQERIGKYREMFSKAQFDIQNRERELTEPIIGKIRKIVEEIGEKDSYTMIFEKSESSVIFHTKKDDLTDRVITAANK